MTECTLQNRLPLLPAKQLNMPWLHPNNPTLYASTGVALATPKLNVVQPQASTPTGMGVCI